MTSLKSVDQAADLLGISPWTVRAYVRDGHLRPVRIGRRVLLEETELERFVRDRTERDAVMQVEREKPVEVTGREQENA